jgi:hypothetical protein
MESSTVQSVHDLVSSVAASLAFRGVEAAHTEPDNFPPDNHDQLRWLALTLLDLGVNKETKQPAHITLGPKRR